ncbi:twin-arginine translocation signal domain-containing protein, partial [Faecalibacterium longum]
MISRRNFLKVAGASAA